MTAKSIVVTGGRGFIGSVVCEELRKKNYTPVCFDRADGADVRNFPPKIAAEQPIEGVIHLAGLLGTDELFDDPYGAVDVNINGTLRVLDACVANNWKY